MVTIYSHHIRMCLAKINRNPHITHINHYDIALRYIALFACTVKDQLHYKRCHSSLITVVFTKSFIERNQLAWRLLHDFQYRYLSGDMTSPFLATEPSTKILWKGRDPSAWLVQLVLHFLLKESILTNISNYHRIINECTDTVINRVYPIAEINICTKHEQNRCHLGTCSHIYEQYLKKWKICGL